MTKFMVLKNRSVQSMECGECMEGGRRGRRETDVRTEGELREGAAETRSERPRERWWGVGVERHGQPPSGGW